MTLNTIFNEALIAPTAFIAKGAIVVGDVTLGAEATVWFNATLRGDTTPVTIGARSNVQEGAILHADPGYPAIIGEGVTIGHGAVVHGARVGNNCLIGIRSVLLNGVELGDNCIVGANALLTQGKKYPANAMIFGSPAKVVRELTAEEIAGISKSAASYVARGKAFRAAWHQLEA